MTSARDARAVRDEVRKKKRKENTPHALFDSIQPSRFRDTIGTRRRIAEDRSQKSWVIRSIIESPIVSWCV